MDRYTLIESYIMNVLSDEDKKAFELRMSLEDDLRTDVESHAKMKLAMDVLVDDDVRGYVAEIGGESTEIREERSEYRDQRPEVRGERTEVRDQRSEIGHQKSGDKEEKILDDNPKYARLKKRRLFLGIAASLLVLVFVGWWGMESSGVEMYDDIFDEFYKAPLSKQTRSGEQVGATETDMFYTQYYEAHDLVTQGNYREAYDVFSNLELSEGHDLEDNRTWFMALVKLKYDPVEALEDIKKLATDPNHKYISRIKKLLKAAK